jgi:hypothetical protein
MTQEKSKARKKERKKQVSIDNGEMTRDGDGQLDDDGGDARPPVNERNVHEAGTQASNVDGEVNPTIVNNGRH